VSPCFQEKAAFFIQGIPGFFRERSPSPIQAFPMARLFNFAPIPAVSLAGDFSIPEVESGSGFIPGKRSAHQALHCGATGSGQRYGSGVSKA
jgi:hypothetical protein